MLTVPSATVKEITESAHVRGCSPWRRAHATAPHTHKTPLFVESIGRVAAAARAAIRRLPTKLGSPLNSAATQGRGDDNDVYEV